MARWEGFSRVQKEDNVCERRSGCARSTRSTILSSVLCTIPDRWMGELCYEGEPPEVVTTPVDCVSFAVRVESNIARRRRKHGRKEGGLARPSSTRAVRADPPTRGGLPHPGLPAEGSLSKVTGRWRAATCHLSPSPQTPPKSVRQTRPGSEHLRLPASLQTPSPWPSAPRPSSRRRLRQPLTKTWIPRVIERASCSSPWKANHSRRFHLAPSNVFGLGLA